MHEPVKVNVENYLDGSQSLPGEFTAHLSACERCRQELAEMKAHSALIGSLKADEEFEPRAGFYARVIERIDSQRQSSIWTIFLDPAFGLRLAMASAALSVLMGLYLVSSEPAGRPLDAGRSTTAAIALVNDDQSAPVLGGGEDQDRGAVLVSLATYQQQEQ